METIFLSYMREDEDVVKRLADALTKHGAQVWRDRESIEAGTLWQEAIVKAITQGTHFVPCFSQSYLNRPTTYMDEELRVACARGRGSSTTETWLLPVSLDGSPIPMFMDERQIINDVHHVLMHPSWQDGLQRLLEATVQPAKKRAMAAIDSDARQLIELELRVFKVEQELEHEKFQQIKQSVNAQITQSMNASNTPAAISTPAYTDLSGYNERVAAATAARAAKLLTYRTNVQAFLSRYKEEYDPYPGMLPELEELKQQLATRMQNEQEANQAFARRVIVALLIIMAILTSLSITLFGS